MKQDKITYTHGKIVNIDIAYELTGSNSDDNDPTVKNFLFGAFTLTKTQIFISTGILAMELDLEEEEVFHLLVLD